MKIILFILALFMSYQSVSSDAEYVVVTGSRIELYESPSITLIKPADYLIQKIEIQNDTRDEAKRTSEIHETIKSMLRLASKDKSIEIGAGNEIIYSIDVNNLKIDLSQGNRPDTSIAYLYIKTPIINNYSVDSLQDKMYLFIDEIKVTGRSEVKKNGELILSIVNPEKYRKELLTKIAEDIKSTVNIFGNEYKADISGLSQALQWERASISELRIYLEYDFELIVK